MQDTLQRHDESAPKPIRKRLWWIVLSPSVWAIHFLACYLTVAIWCAKVDPGTSSGLLLWLVSGYTLVAVGAITAIATSSYRSFRRDDPELAYEFDDPSDRTSFIAFTAFLLSLLSLIATLFTALALLIIRSCD